MFARIRRTKDASLQTSAELGRINSLQEDAISKRGYAFFFALEAFARSSAAVFALTCASVTGIVDFVGSL